MNLHGMAAEKAKLSHGPNPECASSFEAGFCDGATWLYAGIGRRLGLKSGEQVRGFAAATERLLSVDTATDFSTSVDERRAFVETLGVLCGFAHA